MVTGQEQRHTLSASAALAAGLAGPRKALTWAVIDIRRFRILHTLPDLAMGGGQIITLRHLTHYDAGRFEVGLVTFDPPDELRGAFAATGIPMWRLRPGRGRFARTIELARLLRRERVDLLHVHGPLDRKVGLAAAWLARIPAVCQIHSEYVHLGPQPPVGASAPARLRAHAVAAVRDRIEAATVAHYVADSEAAAALFRPLVAQPVTAMDLALPFDAYTRAASGDRDATRAAMGVGSRPLLLNVSRLAEGKGQERLIDLLGPIQGRHPDAALVLVGDGPRRAELEAQASRVGLGGSVFFLGNRHDVAELLHAGDVFVFASRTEGLGVAVAEAMGASLPVVAFQLPALATYCEDGVTGTFPAQDDDDGFVGAVCRLLDDPTLAAAYGAAGHDAVASRFHVRATAACFEAAYLRILAADAADGDSGDAGNVACAPATRQRQAALVHQKG